MVFVNVPRPGAWFRSWSYTPLTALLCRPMRQSREVRAAVGTARKPLGFRPGHSRRLPAARMFASLAATDGSLCVDGRYSPGDALPPTEWALTPKGDATRSRSRRSSTIRPGALRGFFGRLGRLVLPSPPWSRSMTETTSWPSLTQTFCGRRTIRCSAGPRFLAYPAGAAAYQECVRWPCSRLACSRRRGERRRDGAMRGPNH